MALGVEVDLARDGNQALALLVERPYSIIITDLRMPKLDGMKLIEEIQTRRLPVTVIVTTGHGSIDEAVQAMRMGAYDFLTKPPDPQHLCLLVERASASGPCRTSWPPSGPQIGERHAFWNILSKCPRMYDIFELIGHIAETTTTVLIEGETGTGKEQVAQAIHQSSATHRSRAVRGRPLRGVARDAARERAVRSREGGVHRRGRPSARGGSSWPTAAPCSSTRSATSPWRCR